MIFSKYNGYDWVLSNKEKSIKQGESQSIIISDINIRNKQGVYLVSCAKKRKSTLLSSCLSFYIIYVFVYDIIKETPFSIERFFFSNDKFRADFDICFIS